ncbi:glycoside hydrolase family 88 protein [Paenibacillus qinlingensis]|uniref:glycoside hydrolase family 88 protein n=1 Tax=Paenibacillus qinlingensis TaxID=1837343 RepID=UPI0015640371|nr:glycoside hydrolase family 88 protein [Paenibacillus qinlingensis]NQX60718.1 glycoside hydrolase family 88 protein [Paenibacillus qinlingensis]
MVSYIGVTQVKAGGSKVPEGKRIPIGWTAVAIGETAAERVRLLWSNVVTGQPAWLRLTVALDVREEVRVEARSAMTGLCIGEWDIRYASVFQPYQLLLCAEHVELLASEGIELQLIQGSSPLWIFTEGPAEAPLLFPHLLLTKVEPEDPWQRMSASLASLSSLQPFGWLEGCVLDGLLDLERVYGGGKYQGTAKEHLDLFFDANGSLHYENPRSVPVDGRIYGIEGTLPFAALAQLEPNHPAIESAIQYWLSETSQDGTIMDGSMLSAEGSYTIAYPMAVLAKLYKREDLALLAIQQLESRKQRLNYGTDLYLRHHEDGSHSFPNWSRAYGWYMLGLARTLRVIHEYDALYRESPAIRIRINELKEELIRIAEVIVGYQSEQGLWYVYVDDPQTGVETSGSAAIAAALAIGVQLGILGDASLTACKRVRRALTPYLTEDGFLHGVSQNNKADEELQRSGYRVLSQMGTGLAAQLDAALFIIGEHLVQDIS